MDPDHPVSFGNKLRRVHLECFHGRGLAHAHCRPLCAEQERYARFDLQFDRRLQQLSPLFSVPAKSPRPYFGRGLGLCLILWFDESLGIFPEGQVDLLVKQHGISAFKEVLLDARFFLMSK